MNTREAHVHSSNHREEILKSNQCGCFYCFKTFKPEEIKDWIDQEQTAICPFCNIDSVIGDNSGAVLDETFLKEMHKDWFDSVQPASSKDHTQLPTHPGRVERDWIDARIEDEEFSDRVIGCLFWVGFLSFLAFLVSLAVIDVMNNGGEK